MGQYSIKDVETLSGVKAHTLRIWEQRYHFLKPQRTDTNIRYYTDEQLRQLLAIGTLNRNGFKISHIAEMSVQARDKELLKIYEETAAPDNLMDSLIQAMVEFDEGRFEKALSKAIVKLGFEDAFAKLVFPMMIKTGVLWASGTVQVVQEHFVSNLVRRKISAAIDGLLTEPAADAKRFVLFLPEGETHELLLLFSEYLLRKQGQRVVYLGASLPRGGLDFIVSTFKPHYLFTFLTVVLPQPVKAGITQIAQAYPECKIIIGGAQIESAEGKLPPNVVLVHNAQQLHTTILSAVG